MKVYTFNKTDDNHTAKVKEEMNALGAPEIRGFYEGIAFYCIEGSHRLRAAYELGLAPILIDCNTVDEVTIQMRGDEEETFESCDAYGLVVGNVNAGAVEEYEFDDYEIEEA